MCGGTGVLFHAFLTSALDTSGEPHSAATLPPGTHRLGGWVGPRRPSSSAESMFSCASTPAHDFMTWCLIKHRDNFTYALQKWQHCTTQRDGCRQAKCSRLHQTHSFSETTAVNNWLYKMSHDVRSIFWEVIVSVILCKKVYPNGFRDRAISLYCTDEQHAMSSHEFQSALMLTVEFSELYYTR
jgi:hypothetical protein